MKCRGKHLGPTDPLLPMTFKTTCLICGIQIGRPIDPVPATDDERTAIEVRAAELAQNEREHGFREWNGFESLGWVSPDAEHVPLIERDIAEGRDKYPRDLFAYWSGWLAREICERDEDHQ